MKERILEILAETAGMDVKDITPDMEFAKDLSINSVEFADIVFTCEEEFNIEVDEKQFRKIIKVSDLIDYIDNINS